jgi:ketosteroid isomerase-like protein
MSQQNVARLRAWYAGSSADLHAWIGAVEAGEVDLSIFDAEMTYQDDSLPDHAGETYHGVEGLVRASRQMADPFSEVLIEPVRVVGTGDRLVLIVRIRATSRFTGIEFDIPYAYFYTFSNGKIIHGRGFSSVTKALDAAGLAEYAMSQENVEIVRAAFEAWNAPNMDALRELYDPDVVWRPAEGWPELGPVRRSPAPAGSSRDRACRRPLPDAHEPSRAAKNARISSRAAIVGSPASSIRWAVSTL